MHEGGYPPHAQQLPVLLFPHWCRHRLRPLRRLRSYLAGLPACMCGLHVNLRGFDR